MLTHARANDRVVHRDGRLNEKIIHAAGAVF
jgi:hypothetical protein